MSHRFSSSGLWVWSVWIAGQLLVGGLCGVAAGQSPAAEFRTPSRSLITQTIDRSRLATVPGAVHHAAAGATDVGAVDDAKPMEHIQLALRRSAERQAAFDAAVEALNEPGNPNFHHWLTPEQIGSEFGPSAADVATIVSYLQGEGFTLNGVGKSGMFVDFTGTAGQVRTSFRSEVHNYRLASGEVHFSASQAAQIPEALAPAVMGFVSLSDFPAHSERRPSLAAASRLRPGYLNGSGYQALGAQDFYTIYNELPLLNATTPINGAGQTVAVIEQTDITPNDVTVFRTTFGVTPNTPSLTIAHGSSSIACSDPGVTGDEVEAILDAEWAGAAAPGATVLFMACGTGASYGIVLSAEAVIDDNLAGTMSLSYGDSELNNSALGAFMSSLWEQAAAQGQTVVVSAGDSGSDTYDDGSSIGSHGINVNVFGSTAYNVSAGGTDFQDVYNELENSGTSFGESAFWSSSNGVGNLTAKGYIPETTWNDTCASSLINAYEEGMSADATALCADRTRRGSFLAPTGGGGGPSILNARPGWQNGTVYGLPSTTAYTGRLLPDISLFASNGLWGHTLYYYQSDVSPSLTDAGGTSFVAPQLAGVFALIEQSTGSRLGLANVQLYNLAGQQFGTTSYSGSGCNGSGASGIGVTTALPGSGCVFYDVQTGNNSVACTARSTNCYAPTGSSYGIVSTSTVEADAAFASGQGYDMATGIGSLNIANLVNNWSNSSLLASTTTLSLGQTSFAPGTSVSFSTTVSGAGGSPTGTVAVVSGTRFVSGADMTLTGGAGSGSANTFLPGSYTVYAQYMGDGTYAPSVSPGIAVSVQYQTTTTLAAPSPNSGLTYGSTTSLTAAVSEVSVGSYTATGTVTFFDGATAVCSGVAFNSSGVATCTTPMLSVGSHSFTARYGGDVNFTASTSAAQVLTVAQASPSITVNPAAANYGAVLTPLSASVTFAGALAPTGGVMFEANGGTPVAGKCSGSSSPLTCTVQYPTAVLSAGSYGTAALLAADTNYTGIYGAGTLTVASVAPTISFSIANHDVSSAPFAVAATSNSAGAVTYSVASGPATMSGATVTLTGVGTVTIVATQAANGSYTAGSATASFYAASGSLVWIGETNSTLGVTSISGASMADYSGGGLGSIAAPLGIAFDHAGDAWVVNTGSNGGLSVFAGNGTPTTTTPIAVGGVNAPVAVAIDGAGQVWVANGDGSVSELANTGAAITSASGFAGRGISAPTGVAVDLSGNVWVTSSANNTLVEIIGGGAPAAPLATAIGNGTTGQRP